MSFVASKAQVEAFQALSSNPGFSQEAISVPFVTTAEFVKSVLPPGFEPVNAPTGTISVSTWESNLTGPFNCCMAALDCKYRGITGSYLVFLFVSGELAITWGREVWGDPKKLGDARIFRSGNKRTAYGGRRGANLIEMEVEFGNDLPATRDESVAFEVKAYPHHTGIGLEYDPKVIVLNVVENKPARATGKGRLTIRGTKADPLHTMPILSIGDFQYCSGTVEYSIHSEHKLECSADEYLPYLIGRHYDDVSTLEVGSSWAKSEEKAELYPVQTLSSP